MSRPPIRVVPINNDRLSLCLRHRSGEHPEGFWLHDKDACGGLNLAMGAKSEVDALVAAIIFWKERARIAEDAHSKLAQHVRDFVSHVTPKEEE